MTLALIMLGIGYTLAFLLLVLFITLASKNGNQKQTKKVGTDINKIKDQINGE
jgi:hypothetical protein